MTKTRYTSWGCEKSFRWLWQAALQDAIFAFKQRYRKGKPTTKVQVDNCCDSFQGEQV